MAWTFTPEPANPFPQKCPSCEMWQMSWWEDTRTNLVYGECAGCHIMLLSVRSPGIYVMSPTAIEKAMRAVEAKAASLHPGTSHFGLWSQSRVALFISAFLDLFAEEDTDGTEGTDTRRETSDQGKGTKG